MPRILGIEALKVISAQYPKVRTLMFSMHNNPDTSWEAQILTFLIDSMSNPEIAEKFSISANTVRTNGQVSSEKRASKTRSISFAKL